MSYFQGFLLPVPTRNRDAYCSMAKEVWPMIRDYGALGMVETWGADVPEGKVTSLPLAVKLTPEETVVFSWIEWPDRATCDDGSERMTRDPRMDAEYQPPFDGMRMMWGGFEELFRVHPPAGTPPARYVQGFLLAVPQKNRDAYHRMAVEAWQTIAGHGAVATCECWGVDVPDGKVTSFPMAVQRADDEVVVFSWIEWPDRAVCDAGWQAMMQSDDMKMPDDMPFDGMRMMWGGFEILLRV